MNSRDVIEFLEPFRTEQLVEEVARRGKRATNGLGDCAHEVIVAKVGGGYECSCGKRFDVFGGVEAARLVRGS